MKIIKCENYFCIYFYKGSCRLKNIILIIEGLCNSCIYFDIDEKYLKSRRKKLLKSQKG